MRRITAVLLSILLAFTMLLPLAGQARAAKSEPDVIRVQLRNYIGNKSLISVKITKGSYSMAGNPSLILQQDHNYAVKAVNGSLSLYEGNTLIGTYGSSLELVPAHYGTDNVIEVNGRAYIGSMAFGIDGAYVRPISKLMLEDYLKGVVPYEMPASWNKEALKAQAIAARTYAIRCLKPTGSYDVLDTTDNQVYGGYIWNSQSYSNSNAAVDETRGIVLEYNGSPALTEYSSSNGGIVEKSSYSAAKKDEYDPINPWTVTYKKVQIDPVQIDAANGYLAQNDIAALDVWWNSIENITYASRANEKAMIAGVKSLLAPMYTGKDIRITEITDMTMDLSKRTEGQRLPADSHVTMTVKFLTKDIETKAYDTKVIVPEQDPLSNEQAPQPVTELNVNQRTITFTVTQMRMGFGASIIKSYLIDSFEKSGDGYVIKGRGYGHGRGMSQYGAKYRAEAGQNYGQILDFYYPVASRVKYSIPAQPAPAPLPDRGEDRPVPPPAPTPAPAPATQTGTVKVNTTLNVRSGAGTQYKVVGSLKNGTKVEVLGKSGSWYKIKYGGITGYVSGQYLVVSGTSPAPAPTPAPTPAPAPAAQTGTVKVNTTLNVRSGAGTQYKVVGSLKNGTKVEVLGKSGSWYKIKYNGITGYVSGQYMVVSSASPMPAPAPSRGSTTQTGTVKVNTTLNVRSGAGTQYKVVGSLKNGTKVEVLGKSGSWYKIKYGGITGYVSGQYLIV
ncbi:SH3 domain-containing protein [Mahella sp.]|uniref:SH3 domain-containing protein n=1 Tax=Mahella sp. TaxID=2798721 RepID=UPI0025C319DE|nr:SH3 domain-containing protein [Mahella sp.]MBZ4664876.1 SpoIID/LytB domain protein [Mahella sp.]